MDASKNYFELFELPVSFDVDLKLLKEKYQELQKAVHPDRFASASDQERMLSVQQAATINDAFQSLKKPLTRAQYLLKLMGVEYDNENNTIMDPGFLMQQMALREALEEINSAKDPYEAVENIIADIEQSIKGLQRELRDEFAKNANADTEYLADKIRKLQFFEKLRDEAEAAETELDE
jgi:molecular chaperone HscB